MNNQVCFTLLFLSWIAGLSLICLFPPIPDYQIDGDGSGSISQEGIPELNQRATSLTSTFPIDFHSEASGLNSGFDFYPQIQFRFLSAKGDGLIPVPSFF
ncbi:hypothetical protein [Algoriphagus boritolerans]